MKSIFGGATGRVITLGIFFATCAVIMGVLYTGTGEPLPFISQKKYTVSVDFKDADNLVKAAQVQEAGILVGEVRSITRVDANTLRVTLTLNKDAAPIHQGARFRLGSRTLVGESYLALTDGNGRVVPDNNQLPASAAEPSVQLDDVLASVDANTRGQLRSLLRGLGQGTAGTGSDVSSLMTGLGYLGRGGHTALAAISAQSQDLESLARETSTVLQALDTGQGEIADLVTGANTVTKATAGQQAAIERTLRLAPDVLTTATTASDSLTTLSGALGPVATDLRAAAPNLTLALDELPATTTDLRGMMAPLSRVLREVPATLTRIPQNGVDLRAFIPQAHSTLNDVNPMLAYVRPYGPELSAYFANFNAVLNYRDENGAYYLRLTPLLNTNSAQLPVKVPNLLGNYTNAFPAPGSGARPGPFTGTYPRVQREGQ
ncbi:MAG: Mammalian cell entry related domain protein [Marmoricola sp.]|nr:Mammalian cell entry related domain protein [Marmoricola sp.]